MKIGPTKKQKVTGAFYNAKDPIAESYSNDGEHGGLRFEIDKSRIGIRLTAPYSEERRKSASEAAKKRGMISQIK